MKQEDKLSQRIIKIASRIADSYKTTIEDVDFESLIFTWNLSVIEQYDPTGVEEFKNKNLNTSQDKKTRKVGSGLKKEMYPDDLRFITDFQVNISGDEVNLRLTSMDTDQSMFDSKLQNRPNDSNVISIH